MPPSVVRKGREDIFLDLDVYDIGAILLKSIPFDIHHSAWASIIVSRELLTGYSDSVAAAI